MSLLSFRRDRLDKVLTGRFAPETSSTVVVYRAGAQVKGNQTVNGAALLVLAGHYFPSAGSVKLCVMRYSGGAWALVAGSLRSVSSSDATHVTPAGPPLTVLDGDYLVNLGADSALVGATPAFDGSTAVIYPTGDSTGTAISQSRVAPNTQGEYSYYQLEDKSWELIVSGTTPVELRIPPYPINRGTTLPTAGSAPGDVFIVENAGTPAVFYTWLVDASGTYRWRTETYLFNVKDYGAIGDGSADDYTAVNLARAAAESVNGTVFFPRGTYKLGTSITFAYNCTLRLDSGAMLAPDSAKTLRIQGPIDAGLHRIFTGAGTIALYPLTGTEVLAGPSSIPEAPIQWWGCFPNTTADCGPTIQTALAAIAAGTFLVFYGGTFKIATGVVLERRYFNMRGETGGYYPGAGYPTFIWTGADNGVMFTFTIPLGIRVQMCAFDGDYSAATVFKMQSNAAGAPSWNCNFDKCAFVACRGYSFDMGGAHATYNDDFAACLFTNCWFSRPSSRSSDADGNSVTVASIPAGAHLRSRAWNSYNITFETCHFYSTAPSSDANQYDRVGVYNQGGEMAFMNCFFYNRGTDIYVADPNPGIAVGYIRIIGGESQSEELLRVPAIAVVTPNRNFVVEGIRHIQSFGGAYIPTRTTSISFNGAASNNQYALILIGNVFNHDVELGANAPVVIDIENRFTTSKRYTGAGIGQVGGGHGRRDVGAENNLVFTSGGTYQVLVGDTITGATSGATAIVEYVLPLTSGTWAGGTAAGQFELRYQSGTFQAENLNVGGNLNVATIAGNSTASNWNQAAYGHVLARNANNILWFHDAYPNRWQQHDWWWNHKTSDTILARDALQKYVQGTAQSGKLAPFFGSPNYEGDCTTDVNGAKDFIATFGGTKLSLVTKIVPQPNAIYEFLWRVNTGTANNYFDAGVGHIYVMRDTPGAGADSWRILYKATSAYDNLGNGTPVDMTITALFNTSGLATIAYAATIGASELIKITLDAPAADKSATFYGIIRRIM